MYGAKKPSSMRTSSALGRDLESSVFRLRARRSADGEKELSSDKKLYTRAIVLAVASKRSSDRRMSSESACGVVTHTHGDGSYSLVVVTHMVVVVTRMVAVYRPVAPPSSQAVDVHAGREDAHVEALEATRATPQRGHLCGGTEDIGYKGWLHYCVVTRCGYAPSRRRQPPSLPQRRYVLVCDPHARSR